MSVAAAGIGLNCIINTSIRTANSRLRGNTQVWRCLYFASVAVRATLILACTWQGLYVMTKFNNSRFEFIFTSLVKNSPRLFTTVQAVYRSYETTKLYRDLKLRGASLRRSTDRWLAQLLAFSLLCCNCRCHHQGQAADHAAR